MPAKHHIDNINKLIITTWEGVAIDIDLIDAILEYQEDIQCHPDYIDYNEVVDFSKTTDFKLTDKGLKSIGKIASRTDKSEIKRKLALITPSNTAFFLARMYRAYRSFSRNNNKDIRAFTNESDAFEWVKKTH